MTWISELRLDRRFAQLALLQREGGVGEFLDHVGALEPAEVAALGAGRLVGRLVLGQLLE
jgi:hypothetical protein